MQQKLQPSYAIDALLSELTARQGKISDVGGCQAFDQIFLKTRGDPSR